LTTYHLESPDVEEDVVEARGDDLEDYLWRPSFTGDIYELPADTDAASTVIALVQHPCAMRSAGKLRTTLLACVVRVSGQKQRTEWKNRPYAEFAIQDSDGNSFLIMDFDQLLVVSSEVISEARRTLVLSQAGVNLLVQRWIHYNSRVVIPTITIDEQLAPQFAEADLVMDVTSQLTQWGVGSDDAEAQVEAWLSTVDGSPERSRRLRLKDPQNRSAVRREIRSLLAAVQEAQAAG